MEGKGGGSLVSLDCSTDRWKLGNIQRVLSAPIRTDFKSFSTLPSSRPAFILQAHDPSFISTGDDVNVEQVSEEPECIHQGILFGAKCLSSSLCPLSSLETKIWPGTHVRLGPNDLVGLGLDFEERKKVWISCSDNYSWALFSILGSFWIGFDCPRVGSALVLSLLKLLLSW